MIKMLLDIYQISYHDLFSELAVFHLKLAQAVLGGIELVCLFFDESVGFGDLLVDGGVVALHGALELRTLLGAYLEVGVLLAERFKLILDGLEILAQE